MSHRWSKLIQCHESQSLWFLLIFKKVFASNKAYIFNKISVLSKLSCQILGFGWPWKGPNWILFVNLSNYHRRLSFLVSWICFSKMLSTSIVVFFLVVMPSVFTIWCGVMTVSLAIIIIWASISVLISKKVYIPRFLLLRSYFPVDWFFCTAFCFVYTSLNWYWKYAFLVLILYKRAVFFLWRRPKLKMSKWQPKRKIQIERRKNSKKFQDRNEPLFGANPAAPSFGAQKRRLINPKLHHFKPILIINKLLILNSAIEV